MFNLGIISSVLFFVLIFSKKPLSSIFNSYPKFELICDEFTNSSVYNLLNIFSLFKSFSQLIASAIGFSFIFLKETQK